MCGTWLFLYKSSIDINGCFYLMVKSYTHATRVRIWHVVSTRLPSANGMSRPGILPRSWCRYTVPASMTVIQWVADFSERVKQLQAISQGAASGGAKELKVPSSDLLYQRVVHLTSYIKGVVHLTTYIKGIGRPKWIWCCLKIIP